MDEQTNVQPVANLGKILVADDEPALAMALKLKLTKAGFEVSVAKNGEEALDFVSKDEFKLLILDMVMPKVSGFAVLEKLHKDNIKVPVIVISNLSQEEDRQKASEMGAMAYFVKSDTSISSIVDFVIEKLAPASTG